MVDIKRCKRCQHEWISRREIPLQCPRCKSYAWNKDAEKKEGESKDGVVSS